ncbi:metallophosphoesterase [Patescibacteria group bacterium]|nr:metallophosphoesterase [Patescibacteria group bacterium]
MFRRHSGKRRTNIVFVIFRLLLSLVIFVVLLGGIYSAYKHFSGLDPLKLDPQAVVKNILVTKTPREFFAVLSSVKIDPKILGQKASGEKQQSAQALNFRFLVVADSHNDNVNLQKALKQAKEDFSDIQFIIGLGDYTEVGTINELKVAKAELDNSGLRYFLIPGDHDLWDCRNRGLIPVSCFNQVFGPAFQSFSFNGFRLMLLDNSDNYAGFGEEQLKWITQDLEKAKDEEIKGILVFMHEPLFHPSSDHVMGWVEKNLKLQADMLLFELKDAGAKQLFSGHIHYFSQYLEPKTSLSMVTIGALTSEGNPQSPRFAIVSVFDDGSVKVEDIAIK